MRKILISDAVWMAIADRGKFGETEDDVLRRVFKIDGPSEIKSKAAKGRRGRGSRRIASKRMSARVENGNLIVEFEDGAREQWRLPSRSDKDAIRSTRAEAVSFALANGASNPGQTNAVLKALTQVGYHVS